MTKHLVRSSNVFIIIFVILLTTTAFFYETWGEPDNDVSASAKGSISVSVNDPDPNITHKVEFTNILINDRANSTVGDEGGTSLRDQQLTYVYISLIPMVLSLVYLVFKSQGLSNEARFRPRACS